MKILDLGGGSKTKKPGSIGFDKRPAPHVDVVHDLNEIKIYKPDSFVTISQA